MKRSYEMYLLHAYDLCDASCVFCDVRTPFSTTDPYETIKGLDLT